MNRPAKVASAVLAAQSPERRIALLERDLRAARDEADRLRAHIERAAANVSNELVSWGHPDRWPSGAVPAHEPGVRLVALLSRARRAA